MTEITARSGLLSRTQLHVEDTGGPGRPVVLVHGWPLSSEAWSEQVPALRAAGFRAIAYDRRGFGRSQSPSRGYDYDHLADDLDAVLDELELTDVTLVGFSMGGGEVARYLERHGPDRVRSVVFASSVTPYLLQTADNPEGPLTREQAGTYAQQLKDDRHTFYDQFTTQFFSVDGELAVTEEQRKSALVLCEQADATAAEQTLAAWAMTDFRADLTAVHVPTLVIHGDSDALVPFEGSGRRTHEEIADSEIALLRGAPHGCNVSHAADFNVALLDFAARAG
ncbi:MAG: alpha/beta hydrolase [Acidimicrobiales bacterium]|nr:alpha/beta hydrolase [Acidimicrobiales bacterium]